MENKKKKPYESRKAKERKFQNQILSNPGTPVGEQDFTADTAKEVKSIHTSWQNLPPLKKAFCKHYADSENKNATESLSFVAEIHGYTASTRNALSQQASSFLDDPMVIAYTRFLMSRKAVKHNMTREGQIEQTRKFLKIAEEDRNVYAASKILDIQCKMMGYYAPSSIVNVQTTGKINISFGSDETTEHPDAGTDVAHSETSNEQQAEHLNQEQHPISEQEQQDFTDATDVDFTDGNSQADLTTEHPDTEPDTTLPF